jgi:uncharacterized protein (DUF2141 family)
MQLNCFLENAMKKRITTTLIATTALAFGLAASAAHAQTGPLTRAQVRAELGQLRAAGYDQSSGEDIHYPEQLQAAQARVSVTQQAARAADGSSGYGGVPAGTAAAYGNASANDGVKPVYFGQ